MVAFDGREDTKMTMGVGVGASRFRESATYYR